jgi:uncharacterized protein (DUF2267 family)
MSHAPSVPIVMSGDQMSRIKRLLNQTKDIDKDERYMAMNDLISELEGLAEGNQLDVSLQLPVSKAILTLLEDQSSDVQTVAVKCLAVLIRKLAQEQLADIIDKLSALIIQQDKADSRDIYCIGLKTIINNINIEQAEIVGNRIIQDCNKAFQATEKKNTANNYSADEIKDIESSVLEVIRDCLTRFGSSLGTIQYISLYSQLTFINTNTDDSIL